MKLKNSSRMVRRGIGALLLIGAAYSGSASALPIVLQEGTATFSMTMGGGASPDEAIDGIFSDFCCDFSTVVNGWTTAPDTPITPGNQTAVWETASNVGPGALTLKLFFNHWNPGHLLGRFRLSVTTDDRSTFADGLDANGDVSANWTILTNGNIQGPAGMGFTILPDDSILAGGVIPAQGTYELDYLTSLAGITGVRLDTLTYPGLPGPDGLGPGFFMNGAFVLTEITLDAALAPEPATLALLGIGLAGVRFSRRKQLK